MNALMNAVLDKVDLFVDIGIKIELLDFLKETDNIKRYKIKEEIENYYTIEIELEEYSEKNVEISFDKFIGDMRYEYGGLFIKSRNIQENNCKFITFNSEMKGFYCDIHYF